MWQSYAMLRPPQQPKKLCDYHLDEEEARRLLERSGRALVTLPPAQEDDDVATIVSRPPPPTTTQPHGTSCEGTDAGSEARPAGGGALMRSLSPGSLPLWLLAVCLAASGHAGLGGGHGRDGE